MVLLQGTKEEISQQVDSMVSGSEILMKNIITTIEDNRSLLTKDDVFNKVTPGSSGTLLVIPKSNFYINLSKDTFVVAGIIASLMTGDSAIALIDIFGALFGNRKEFDLWARLDTGEGQTCILLEAARERKKGINREHFSCECFNNQLECGLRCDGKCRISEDNLDGMVDDNLLIKKRRRYYYKDWF